MGAILKPGWDVSYRKIHLYPPIRVAGGLEGGKKKRGGGVLYLEKESYTMGPILKSILEVTYPKTILERGLHHERHLEARMGCVSSKIHLEKFLHHEAILQP